MRDTSQIRPKDVDPVTLEVLRNMFLSTALEMSVAERRTAYSVIINEFLDMGCALLDEDCNLVAVGYGFPVLLASIGLMAKETVNRIGGKQSLQKGDVILCNDPFVTGEHIMNAITTSPIFYDGELLGYSISMGHWADIGGKSPGLKMDTTDVYQEGLRIPPTKLYSAGRLNDELMRMIVANVRLPDMDIGDMRAQVGACKVGERRLEEIASKYGAKTVKAAMKELLRQSEELSKLEVNRMREGRYEAETFLDDDNLHLGVPIRLKVLVTIKGGRFHVDFSEMNPQVSGPVNAGYFGGVGMARAAFKAVTTPQRPLNEGDFAALDVNLPSGKIMSAEEPASTSRWSQMTSTVVDIILKAVQKAVPDRIPAGHVGDIGLYSIHGVHPKTKKLFTHILSMPGGWGGRPTEDGESATIAFHEGHANIIPVEVLEKRFPMRVEEYALRTDSGGAGRFRGGLGVRRRFRVLTDDTVIALAMERTKFPPWGMMKGKEGAPQRAEIINGGKRLVTGKVLHLPLERNALVVEESGGGGGYGSPYRRDADRVLTDVSLGYVSPEGAKRDYGVVVDRRRMKVDLAATRAQRGRLLSKKRIGSSRRRRHKAR